MKEAKGIQAESPKGWCIMRQLQLSIRAQSCFLLPRPPTLRCWHWSRMLHSNSWLSCGRQVELRTKLLGRASLPRTAFEFDGPSWYN